MTCSQSLWQIGAAVCGTSQKIKQLFPPKIVTLDWFLLRFGHLLVCRQCWWSSQKSCTPSADTEAAWKRGWFFSGKGSPWILRTRLRDASVGSHSAILRKDSSAYHTVGHCPNGGLGILPWLFKGQAYITSNQQGWGTDDGFAQTKEEGFSTVIHHSGNQ